MEQRSTTDSAQARRVLGDLSPNVKPTTSSLNPVGSKALTGSPLKRSFTASIEGGHGFTYLKKRKLSADRIPNRRSTEPKEGHGLTSSQLNELEGNPQSVQSGNREQSDIPSVQQMSPTEPNTPTPSASPEEGNDSSAERKSFSSLINYEPSSQGPPQAKSKLVFNGPSFAEVLRLRLRVAIYKVQTNQVDVPFGELQVEGAQDPPNTRPTQAQVEEAVAALRREAQMKELSRRPQLVSKLLPAPILRPTAFSSRTISDWKIPSSPPVPESSDDISPPSTARRSTWPDESAPPSSGVPGRLTGELRNSV